MTADRTTATKRVPMSPLRRTALVAGVLYLLTFVSIPTLALYGPVRDPNYIVGPRPAGRSVAATLFDLWGQLSAVSAILTLPIAVWEFSLGVYLIVKGFKPSPITAAMATA
jgi:hypothetical protein